MQKTVVFFAIVFVLTACGNSSDSSRNSGSTADTSAANPVPSMVDTSVMARRMGDTTGIMGDSTK